MSRANEERYVFETEWYDIQAALIRKYLFTFYPTDNTIEMVSHPARHALIEGQMKIHNLVSFLARDLSANLIVILHFYSMI